MNQMFLSAVFLQKALAYSPQERIFRPEIRVERSLKSFVDKNNNNFAEDSAKDFNKNFYRQLAKPRNNKTYLNSSLRNRTRRISKIPRKTKTTLIIAPHPDDEILGTANLIKEKLKSHEKIKIIYLTNGDAMDGKSFKIAQRYGQYRKTESIRATQQLGLKKSNLFFLGFPDGYLDKLPQYTDLEGPFTEVTKDYFASSQKYGRHRQHESIHATQQLGLQKSDLYFLGFPDAHSDKLHENKSLQSKFTGRDKTYNDSYFPNLKYSRNSLRSALKKLIEKIKPDEIYFTEAADFNVDHAIVGELLPENIVYPESGRRAKKFTYNIHRTYCENEICECDQEIDQSKLRLIEVFKSQRFTPHHEKFLDQFACQKEVFTEIE